MSYVKYVWEDGDELSTEQINEISATLEEVDLRDYFEIGKENQTTPLNLPNNGLFFKYVRVNENLHTYEILKYVDGNLVPLPLDAFTVKGRDICAEFDALNVDEILEELGKVRKEMTGFITGETIVGMSRNLYSSTSIESGAQYTWRTTGGSASLGSGSGGISKVFGRSIPPAVIEESITYTKDGQVQPTVQIDNEVLYQKVGTAGTYIFTYNNDWYFNGEVINISEYGIIVSEPYNGDSLTVNVVVEEEILTITYQYSMTVLDYEVFIVDDVWVGAVSGSGYYTFTYNNGTWRLAGNPVSLSTYGISVSGTIYNGASFTVNYQALEILGKVKNLTPQRYVSVGMNQFDKLNMVIKNATINSSGVIVSSVDNYVCVVPVAPNAFKNRDTDYTIYSESRKINRVGLATEYPSVGSVAIFTGVIQSNELSYVQFTNTNYSFPAGTYFIVVACSDTKDICVHATWSGYMDKVYTEYTVGMLDMPNVIPEYGLVSAGEYQDILDLKHGVLIKYFSRVEFSRAGLKAFLTSGATVVYDEEFIYYTYGVPMAEIYFSFIDQVPVDDFGTEQFIGSTIDTPCIMEYPANLVDKLRTDVLTISAQTLSDEEKRRVWSNLGLFDISEEGF